MKKIILLISMAVAFVSCETGKRIEEESRHNSPKIIVTERYDEKGVLILDIEHEGNRHEFITSSLSYGLTHWPSCKYCEDNKQ